MSKWADRFIPPAPRTGVQAFTLGNPEVYEQSLAEGEVFKAPGGVVYATHEEAQHVIDVFDGHLPPAWFDGKMLPGCVYELALPGPLCEVAERRKYGMALRVQARIVVRRP